jgi:tetratricopeptide (TPR) repeat protein
MYFRFAAAFAALSLAAALHAETLLILPFFNHSTSPALDWIGESISEQVRDSLVTGNLLVLDREDRLEAYRRLSLRPGAELTHASIIKLAQTLDADTVLFGFYELFPSQSPKDQSKGTLRITARMIDLKKLSEGAEFSELGAIEELVPLEVHLSWQALNRLSPSRMPSEQVFLHARPAVRLDAVESYIRGLLAPNAEERRRYFSKAARLDEHYSQPRFQLGKAAWAGKDYRAAAEWLEHVDRSDPHYYEAQFRLGLCRYYSGDFAAAEQSFQLVAAAFPLNEVYNDLAAAQSRRNNIDAALANYKKALEGDSADPDYHFNLGYVYWLAGKFSEAVASFRNVLERNPGDSEATILLGRALKQDGPHPGDTQLEARERIKIDYEETGYRQLKDELQSKH